ncbi:MAG: Chemotaxis protein CheW [Herbinix sp.]|jgi:purine-binding chemotaxis protein CheW|nr:Chemotaxis protein CheW [Herbinix sp.]
MQSTKQAVFMLGDKEYGMDIMEVNIIEKFMNIEPVASFPSNLKGIIKLRGEVIPVCSLRRKFGLEDTQPNDDTRFIVTTSNGIQVAYEVDKMSEIVQFEADQIFDVPAIVKSKDTSYMKLVTNIDDRLIVILDHDGILTADEQDKIKAVIKK